MLAAIFVFQPAQVGQRQRLARLGADGAGRRRLNGAAFGLLPIGWIVLAAIFLYTLTVETGQFEIVKHSVAALSDDRRIQALLIAFCFGAFVEGAAGFGTPVAISAALMMGAGFKPLYAAGLALLANTSPVAFGALGTPIITLAKVTGLDELKLSAMAGRQLPFFSLIVPVWLVWVMAGWRGVARRLAGAAGLRRQLRPGAVPGRQLSRPLAGRRRRRPDLAGLPGPVPARLAAARHLALRRRSRRAAGASARPRYTHAAGRLRLGAVGAADGVRLRLGPAAGQGRAGHADAALDASPGAAGSAPSRSAPRLHPVVPRQPRSASRRTAVYDFNWLSATGTGIFLAAVLSAVWLRHRRRGGSCASSLDTC